MNAYCRYYPVPRPSLKTEHSPKPSYGYCSCNPPCRRDSCTGSDQPRKFTNYPDGSTPPYHPQPPSPHVHFLGYQKYFPELNFDRSSAVTMSNKLALPARGCPGKTYFSTDAIPAKKRKAKKSKPSLSPSPGEANGASTVKSAPIVSPTSIFIQNPTDWSHNVNLMEGLPQDSFMADNDVRGDQVGQTVKGIRGTVRNVHMGAPGSTDMTPVRAPGPVGQELQFQTHAVKPLARFLTLPYVRAQNILHLARCVNVFHMQSIHIARQVLHLVILLNEQVDLYAGPSEQQQDERIDLGDELNELERDMKEWGFAATSDDEYARHTIQIRDHYGRLFKERFYFHNPRDLSNDRTYQKILAYDRKTIAFRKWQRSRGATSIGVYLQEPVTGQIGENIAAINESRRFVGAFIESVGSSPTSSQRSISSGKSDNLPSVNAQQPYCSTPSPSTKTKHSSNWSRIVCPCSPPCSGGSCTRSNQTETLTNDTDFAIPPYSPQLPISHVDFPGPYQTYLLDHNYDRSSTVVMPNELAPPARGYPRKMYCPTHVTDVARTGRRLGRRATPGASRTNYQSRINVSPPPSSSLYAKNIFYPGAWYPASTLYNHTDGYGIDEYPFPFPIQSPHEMDTPPFVSETRSATGVSKDYMQSLSELSEAASQTAGHTGSQLSLTTRTTRDMFVITNGLNGLDISSGGSGGMGVGSVDSQRAPHSPSDGIAPKKRKPNSSLPSSAGEANGDSTAKRRGIVSPTWRIDSSGALGGF